LDGIKDLEGGDMGGRATHRGDKGTVRGSGKMGRNRRDEAETDFRGRP
jgi:hypothetical protein